MDWTLRSSCHGLGVWFLPSNTWQPSTLQRWLTATSLSLSARVLSSLLAWQKVQMSGVRFLFIERVHYIIKICINMAFLQHRTTQRCLWYKWINSSILSFISPLQKIISQESQPPRQFSPGLWPSRRAFPSLLWKKRLVKNQNNILLVSEMAKSWGW